MINFMNLSRQNWSEIIKILKIKKNTIIFEIIVSVWLRGIDSNYRPLGYEPNELPTAPPRDIQLIF